MQTCERCGSEMVYAPRSIDEPMSFRSQDKEFVAVACSRWVLATPVEDRAKDDPCKFVVWSEVKRA